MRTCMCTWQHIFSHHHFLVAKTCRRLRSIDRSTDQSDLHISCTHDSESRIRRYPRFENDPICITIVTTYESSRMFSLCSCVATPSAICASHHCTYTTVHHFLNKNSSVKDDGPRESVDNRRHKSWLQSFVFQTFRSINSIIIFYDS